MTTIKDRVQAGAALLDKVLPDWWNGKEKPTIDLKILDMDNGGMCVLGQCFGEYQVGCQKLGITPWSADFKKGEPDAKTLGFLGSPTADLTTPWRREIKRRRRRSGH